MISFFFFKQQTAYEMRISDCSSDVCSSDLNRAGMLAGASGIMGCAAAVVGSLWRARQNRLVTTYGSSRWANKREIDDARLFRAAGVFLGRPGGPSLRHDGPEHVLAFAPPRSGQGVRPVIPTLLSSPGLPRLPHT